MTLERRQHVVFRDLGLIPYREVWETQGVLNKALIDDKRSTEDRIGTLPHTLIFCEHPPVYTLGKSGSEDHLLANGDKLNDLKAEFIKINRGGDITFHGPGQIVGYPIFDLERFFTDVHRYVRTIEQCIIDLLAHYNLDGLRLEGYTGVWLHTDSGGWRKICAIGVHLSRWVTMHGFALNVNTNLGYFDHIVPCGIGEEDKTVTSITKELGRVVDNEEVKSRLKDIFALNFEFEYITTQKHIHDAI